MEKVQLQKISRKDFEKFNASIVSDAIQQLDFTSKSKETDLLKSSKNQKVSPANIPENSLGMELIDGDRIRAPFSGRLLFLFDRYPALRYDANNDRWVALDNIYSILSHAQNRDGILSLASVAGAKGQIAWQTFSSFDGWRGFHVQTGPICYFQQQKKIENDLNIICKIKVTVKVKIDWDNSQLPHIVLESGQFPNDGLVWALGHIGLSLYYYQGSNLPYVTAPVKESLMFSRIKRAIEPEEYGPRFSDITISNEMLVNGPGYLYMNVWPMLNCITYRSFPPISPGENAMCMIDFRTDRFDFPITEESREAPGGITIEDFAIEIYGVPKIEIEGPVIHH